MVLPIILYGNPTLRQKGKHIDRVTTDIRALVDDMLETMRACHGIGLAAQQIGRALQLTVVDVTEVTDRPSWVEQDGLRREVSEFMPLVLINPKITPAGPVETGPEGCLSFPEMYADISRPGEVEVEATNADGERVAFRCGGLLARAVQHEVDHLNGILFIDRMNTVDKSGLQAELDALRAETLAQLQKP